MKKQSYGKDAVFDDQDDAEMVVVDSEEKEVEPGGDDAEDEEEEESGDDEERRPPGAGGDDAAPAAAGASASASVPFLDAFYSLSSADPQERARAAQDVIRCCLTEADSSNAKDASYALRRLLNGLCSGRAAARQGNASALASFLKVATQQGGGILGAIRAEAETPKEGGDDEDSSKKKEKDLTDLAFVRSRLIAATEPADEGGSARNTRRKSSEDRDSRFGRLFGILAVVRSGTLLPGGDEQDADDILAVSSAYVKDLAALYSYKRWMREPAAHAVGTLLNSFYAVCPQSPDAVRIVNHLVNNVVVPELLAEGDDVSSSKSSEPFFATYSAEQVALALNIQAHASFHSKGLPKPINEPVLSKETLPFVAPALIETSSVTQPRTHLVWDALCSFVSEPAKETSTTAASAVTVATGNVVEVRKMRQACPVGSESVQDLLEAVVRHVVMDRLLKIDQDGKTGTTTKDGSSGKATHERAALALCLVRDLSGVEFVSSITGRTRLVLDPAVVESVLFKPEIVKALFINTIGGGALGGGNRKQGSHLLKPLALQVVESITAALNDGSDDSSDQISLRFALAEPILRTDPRFDSKTKTSIVARLVQVTDRNIDDDDDHSQLWDRYVSFIENQVAGAAANDSDGGNEVQVVVTPYIAQGYLHLLFLFEKMIMKRDNMDSKLDSSDSCSEASRRVLGYLMATAFFDCHLASDGTKAREGKKKNKKKEQKTTYHPAVQSAVLIRSRRSGAPALLPFDVRSNASTRFFSVVADLVFPSASRGGKEWAMLNILSDLIQAWDDLETAGAVRLDSQVEDESSDDEKPEDPKAIVKELRNTAERLKQEGGDDDPVLRARMKCSVGFSILASTLYLYLLNHGRPEELVEDDLEAEDDNDGGDVREFMADLKETSALYSESKGSNDRLSVLAGLCANILSSPLAAGNTSRGGSVLREAVKYAWIGGLTLSAASGDKVEKDSNFLDILLDSIGLEAKVDAMDEEGESSDDSDSDDKSESGDDVNIPGTFTGAAKSLLDDAVMNDEKEENEDDRKADDIELDPERLQSVLEEDSDADVSEGQLEHHAGADKALAKLIQMKQEARKVGQMARERAVIAQQRRCIVLLETLVSGRNDEVLLSSEKVLQMILPILRYRQELEKSISKARSDPGLGEKRAFLKQLSTLLQTKILKAKHTDLRWRDSAEAVAFCTDLAPNILVEIKRPHASKDQISCCSKALTLVVRAVPSPAGKIEVAKVYSEAVQEWSSQGTTRLETGMFEDLIHDSPVVAQASLVSPLATAASETRKPFLKSEAFRCLSSLYNVKLNSNTTDLEKIAFDRVLASVGPVIDALTLSLKDTEMRKAKRAKEVLQTMEKVFIFLSSSNQDEWKKVSGRKDVKELLEELKSSSNSAPVAIECERLLSLMNDEKRTAKAGVDPIADASDDVDDDGESGEKEESGRSSKKKKNKSKKTKKRKR